MGRKGRISGDALFRGILYAFAISIPLLLLTIAGQLFVNSWPSIKRFGLGFVFNSVWDPVQDIYGSAPPIYGTLVSSALALLIAVPLAVGVSIYLTEFAPQVIRKPVSTLIELLAAIPSVVYGLWGIFVMVPILKEYVVPKLQAVFGWTPFFGGDFFGPSMLAAGLILAIMILPFISSVSREVLMAVPNTQREAALALGATRWEAVWTAVLPYGKAGIIGAVMLGLGRALGETMAVTMVIGNTFDINLSLLDSGYSMAAVLANQFQEAATTMQLSALFEIGFVLFVITVLVNSIARLFVRRISRRSPGR